MLSGIYCIRNIVNGKVYVGKSKNVQQRWDGHLSNLIAGSHPNVHLREDCATFGVESFVFELLEECDVSALREKEIEWHHRLKTYLPEFGYNRLTAFDGFNQKHSSVSKAKISAVLRGRVVSAEVRSHMAEASRKAKTPEVRSRLRDAALAQHARMSDEERAAVSARISEANRGREIPVEVREKVSTSVRAWWASRPGRDEVLAARREEQERYESTADERREQRLNRMRETYANMTDEEKRKKFGRGAVTVRDSVCVICGQNFVSHKGRNGRWQERCDCCKGKWRR